MGFSSFTTSDEWDDISGTLVRYRGGTVCPMCPLVRSEVTAVLDKHKFV